MAGNRSQAREHSLTHDGVDVVGKESRTGVWGLADCLAEVIAPGPFVPFNTIDRVGDLAVFDIGGNKYRLIVYIKAILTHREYDKGGWRQ